jgi:DNA mismatch repair protein MutS2
LKFRAGREDLRLLESAPAQAASRAPARPAPELSLESSFTPELNVVGLYPDDAVERVDKFLDEAFLSGTESVRIIHGHGKGVLRRAIAEHLKGHPQVEGFHPAPPDKGGGGATVVDLRR